MGIGGVIKGKPQVFVSYTVTVTSGGGKVLSPCETPMGYSLWDIAAGTAVYNVGGGTGTVPKIPFQMLVGHTTTYTVKPDTMLYVPVFYADDSGSPGTPPFPTDLRDQKVDADYLLEMASQFSDADITAFFVQVDGKNTILDDDYVVGVKTAPLPDGTPEGHHYILSAAFLAPLNPGAHTVGIGGVIDGVPQVFVSNTVTVKP